jgi:hypothetical protein
MPTFDFIEKSTLGSGFLYKSSSFLVAFSYSNFIATTGFGTTSMNISSVEVGQVTTGMVLSGETLFGTPSISSFGTFNGTSGTVTISEATWWNNPSSIVGTGWVTVTDPDYPSETVRGICYLDGTYYVMTPGGTIHGSEIENPLSWSALNVIQAHAEPDLGVALFRQKNLLVAFGEYSTQFFYNAGNPTGSPLLPYTSANLELGCASADSIAQAEDTLYFIGRARQRGRSIYQLVGTEPKKISTAYIDRLLDADPLENVRAYFLKITGHGFYILTLNDTGITLVYDTSTGLWNEWTQMRTNGTVTFSAMSWTNNQVTVTATSHGLSDGDYVSIASSNPSGYNYSGAINVVNANTFTFPKTTNPGSYVGSAVITKYIEEPYDMAAYAYGGNLDLVQDSTTGSIYAVLSNSNVDHTAPIKYEIRTSKFDGGNNGHKYYAKMELIGDKVDGTAWVRYSDDDYQTWSKYRPVNLAAPRSQLYRTGRGRRRAYDIINYDDKPIRLEAIEITATEGMR